ncbi:MAG: NPCBM/NEW2 domain-containing protein [Planctomycetota bacterium]
MRKRMILAVLLPASVIGLASLSIAADQTGPDVSKLYVKKATFTETLLATRTSLRKYNQERGFSPVLSYLMRKGSGPLEISVDVSTVDQMFLVAFHEAQRCRIPAVWGDAKLIGKDSKEIPLGALKPALKQVPYGAVAVNRGLDGKPLSVAKAQFKTGISTLTPGELSYKLDKKFKTFTASIGVCNTADKPVSIRLKVLDRPDKESIESALWERIARDFPLETSQFYSDGPYWLSLADSTGLEKHLTNAVAGRMGPLGEGIKKELQALWKTKPTPDDPRGLQLFAKACRFQSAATDLQRANLAAMRRLIEGHAADSGKWLERLKEFEGRQAAIHQAMIQADESALAQINTFVADAQALLREMLLPIVGADEIVYALRHPGRDGHWYANFAYWCSDPEKKIYSPDGGRLCKLNLRTGKTTVLLDDPKGAFRDPQVHYDGKKIAFSWRRDGAEYYNLYEINTDGTGLRRLTSDPCDDYEATYLPDGDIIFCSTRCLRWVNCWHTQVGILYRCDADGQNIRVLSSNIEHDNTPWPLLDGRILYTRWEYVDRSQMVFHHLWTVNPDGTGQMTYYGNMHPGMVFIDAKPIPGTDRIVAVFCPGHGRREHAGVIRVVTPNAGPDDQDAAKIINPNPVFRDPYPLAEDLFLVVYENQMLLMDGQGETQEVCRGDIMLHEPRPIRPRPREPVMEPHVDYAQATGRLILQDVYEGRNMVGVKRGEIKKLLVLESLPKPVSHSGGMDMISGGGTFTIERVLGTVPVEPDGSAYFEVPANRPVFFVALDANDLSVKRMHSFCSVVPGERTGCVGCHEPRGKTPALATEPVFQALRRPPSKIARFDGLPDVIDFPRHVQPILTKHCVKCHNPEKFAGKAILTADYGARYGDKRFTTGYWTLLLRGQLADNGNYNGNTAPRTIGSGASPLMKKIMTKHNDVALSEDEKRIIWMWLETGAAYAGSYAALASTSGPSVWGAVAQHMGRCRSCHTQEKMTLPTGMKGNPPHYWREIPPGAERFHLALIVNESRPEKSLVLLAPLAKEAGGLGICPGPVFKDVSDPDYQKMLAAIAAGKEYLDKTPLYCQPEFRPDEHYIREMKRYGILPRDLPPDAPIDVYATDQVYWRSFWYAPRETAKSGEMARGDDRRK